MIRIPGVQKVVPNTVALQSPQVQQVEQTEGLQMLGQAATTTARVGNTLAALAEQGMRNARVSKAREGQARAVQEINRLLEDRESGYLMKQGGSARDTIGDFERELDAVQTKLSASFDDDETREMFEQSTATDFMRAKTSAGIHWAKQSKVANAAQAKVRIDQLAAAVAEGSWADRTTLKTEVDEYGKLIGLSVEQRDELYDATLSQSAFTYVSTLMDEGDLDGADAWLKSKGENIDRANRAKLENQLTKERKSQAAMGKAAKTNRKAQAAVFDLMDRFKEPEDEQAPVAGPGGYVAPGAEPPEVDRYSAILEELEQQRRINIDDPSKGLSPEEYNVARSFLNREMTDETATKKAVIAADLDVIDRAFTETPSMTMDELSETYPNEVRRLGTSTEGRDLLRRLTTAEGKAKAEQFYFDIDMADATGDSKMLQQLFPLDKDGKITNIEQLAGFTGERKKDAYAMIRRAHGMDVNDEGRLQRKDLIRARFDGMAWAHKDGDVSEPLNANVVDDMVRQMNRELPSDASADEQAKWLDHRLSGGTYRYADDSFVPRAVLRSLPPAIAGQVKGMTTHGAIKPSDINRDVRALMFKAVAARPSYAKASDRQIAQRAEALWLMLGSPTTTDAAEKALKKDKAGEASIGSNLHKWQVKGMLQSAGDLEAVQLARLEGGPGSPRELRARELAENRLRAELNGKGELNETYVLEVMQRLLRGAEAYNNATVQPKVEGNLHSGGRMAVSGGF